MSQQMRSRYVYERFTRPLVTLTATQIDANSLLIEQGVVIEKIL